jgi:tetratricopeptide (TPR) repeat protein
MKKQSRRARASSITQVPVRHQFDHVVPTVIHRPEEKMTALARLTHQVLREPRKYSTWALTVLLVVLAVIVISRFSSGGRSQSSEAWTKLESAKKAEQRVDVAKEYPDSPLSTWALLMAATEYYNNGLADLPNNRDVALPLFKKALDLFDQVARETPKDSFQARAGALGKARSLEARNELAKAIEQYELIASSWPGTPEADQAKQLAEHLKKPEAVTFYKELYAYSPTKVTLPPLNTEELNLPPTGVNLPGTKTSAATKSSPLSAMPLELAPPTALERSRLEPPRSAHDAKQPQSAAKNDSPSNAAKKIELPSDVLSPPSGAPKDKAPR